MNGRACGCCGTKILWTATIVVGLSAGRGLCEDETKQAEPQYAHEEITIAAATADEPILKDHSVEKAVEYLQAGATVWTKKKGCISCHTNGVYLLSRPALTDVLGPPVEEFRQFYVAELRKLQETELPKLKASFKPTQVAFLAGGLAEWDAHITKALSDETREALDLLLSVQAEDGSFSNQQCWPPYESSDYHGSTVAAMALATAPGYLDTLDEEQAVKFQQLVEYLQNEPPPHDYGRLLLLWTSTRVDGLISDSRKQEIIDMIFQRQRDDGGWALRTFGTPETWGNGSRADKLREEPEYENPPSDGHQTGLAIMVLRDAGVAADDPRIVRGVEWIKQNQRESGRWWTRSLNNDRFHFITYSGTCYPLLALAKTNQWPSAGAE